MLESTGFYSAFSAVGFDEIWRNSFAPKEQTTHRSGRLSLGVPETSETSYAYPTIPHTITYLLGSFHHEGI